MGHFEIPVGQKASHISSMQSQLRAHYALDRSSIGSRTFEQDSPKERPLGLTDDDLSKRVVPPDSVRHGVTCPSGKILNEVSDI